MTVKTIINFGRRLNDEEYAQWQDALNEALASGKAIGTHEIIVYEGQQAFSREWATTADAQGWIDFNSKFVPPPVTALVVEQ